jgi:hypothetical protein
MICKTSSPKQPEGEIDWSIPQAVKSLLCKHKSLSSNPCLAKEKVVNGKKL